MRLFLAILPPPDVMDSIVQAQTQLRGYIERQGVRFVKPHKMHLTLAFLGDDADPEDVPAIASRVLGGSGTLQLSLGSLDCFPDRRRPKVVCLRVNGEGLSERANDLRRSFGLPEDPFLGHITLARISPASQAVGRLMTTAYAEITPSGEWTADEVGLIKTLPDGDYETLDRYFL